MLNSARIAAGAMSAAAGLFSSAFSDDLSRAPPARDFEKSQSYQWDGLNSGGMVRGAYGVWMISGFAGGGRVA